MLVRPHVVSKHANFCGDPRMYASMRPKIRAVISISCFHRLSIPYKNITSDAKSKIHRDFGDYFAAASYGREAYPIDIV